jgi:amino acid adenylation domain-containing protein
MKPSEVAQSIGRSFETVAERWPERIALDAGCERLCYRELDAAANRVAQRVREVCGPEPARVALIFERPTSLIPSLLGVLKAGAVYVPVDPTFPAARVAYVLKDAEAGLVLCDDETGSLARDLVAGGRPLVNVDTLTGATAAGPFAAAVEADAIASLFYTSGSTGEPKGVIQSHRNLLQYAHNYIQALQMRPADRMSLLFSYSFSGSIPDIFGSLLCGAALCPFDVRRRGPAPLARWLRESRITLLHCVPTLFRHFASQLEAKDSFPALRAIDLGGEAVFAADVATFRRRFPPDCVLVHRFAATEASLISRHRVDREAPVRDGVLPVGLPVEGMQIRIEGPDGEALAPGEAGEIVLRSRFLSPGYWRKPELTARAFCDDPEGDGLRRYRTGDRGRRRADGALEHLGRIDQRLKIRGFSVESAEVEVALRALDGVRDCAVTARETPGGDAMLVAFVLSHPQAELAESRLRRILLRTLPAYMVPARIELVDELPLSATGKVDRKLLITAELPSATAAAVAPANAAEAELAWIWRQELGQGEIGVRDDYFALGGTSLQAVQIMTRIEEQFGRDLPPSSLLDAPTIEELAALLERDEFSETASLAVALRARGSGPPLFCFPGAGGEPLSLKAFVRRLGGDYPCYGVQMPGLVGRRRPPRRIADWVDPQLAAIRAIQPEGPYFLLGSSFGSILAFEVAQRLRAAGERVAFLAFIDGWAPGHPALGPDASPFHRLLDRWLGPVLLEHERVSPYELIYKTLKMRGRGFLRLLRAIGGRPLSAKQRRQRRKRTSVRARNRYRPQVYDGRVALVRVSDPTHRNALVYDPLRGWEPFVSGGFDVSDVEGQHTKMLKEPLAGAVAAKVAAAIEPLRSKPEAAP